MAAATAGSVTIFDCPFSDTGNFDNDNDCGSPFSAPTSERFYTYTPTLSGSYQFRLTTSASSVGIRVVSGACCTNGSNVGYASTNVASDCGETANKRTYLSVTLVGGVQYWIHVGMNSGNSTADYTLDMTCVPCPASETSGVHNTCETAQALACNDSVLGSGATSNSPDWYSVHTEPSFDLVIGWVAVRGDIASPVSTPPMQSIVSTPTVTRKLILWKARTKAVTWTRQTRYIAFPPERTSSRSSIATKTRTS
ncbi:MAG: hypothetical protein IPP40_15050 [bacterium]|nr:hypothetical protein [bacterium]